MDKIEKIKDLIGKLDSNVQYNELMLEFYQVHTTQPLEVLTEENLNRIINKHGNNGFVIISAHRSNIDNETNNKNTKSLISDLRSSQYGYVPVYGGYHGTDNVADSYEPSFIVFNNKAGNGETDDFSKLKKFAIEMCGKYVQNSVLIKEPELPPVYMNKDGEVVGFAKNNNVDLNNPQNEFYTSLIKTKNLDYTNPERLKRFSYDMQFECYCNPKATTLNELQQRKKGYGEIVELFIK